MPSERGQSRRPPLDASAAAAAAARRWRCARPSRADGSALDACAYVPREVLLESCESEREFLGDGMRSESH